MTPSAVHPFTHARKFAGLTSLFCTSPCIQSRHTVYGRTHLFGSWGGLGRVVKLVTLCLRLSSASFPTREAFFWRRSFLSEVRSSIQRFRRSSSWVSSLTFSVSLATAVSFSSKDCSRCLILLAWSSGERLCSSLLELRFRLPKRLLMVFTNRQAMLYGGQACMCTYTFDIQQGVVSTLESTTALWSIRKQFVFVPKLAKARFHSTGLACNAGFLFTLPCLASWSCTSESSVTTKFSSMKMWVRWQVDEYH